MEQTLTVRMERNPAPRKVGRPHNEKPRNRDQAFQIRLTAKERQFIETTASNLRLTQTSLVVSSLIPNCDLDDALIYKLGSRTIILSPEEKKELLTQMGFTELEQLAPFGRSVLENLARQEQEREDES